MVIQANLTDGNHPCMCGETTNFGQIVESCLAHALRMYPDRRIDGFVRLGQRNRVPAGGDVSSQCQDSRHPGLVGPRDHRLQIAGELTIC